MREAAACVSFALVDIDLVLVFLSLLLQSIITTDNLTIMGNPFRTADPLRASARQRFESKPG